MTDEQELSQILNEIERREKGNLRRHLFPATDVKLEPGVFPATHQIFANMDTIYSRDNYPKHLDFFNSGKEYHQRLFMAGNRIGKTLAACFELSLHLDGNYPDWWEGKRFETCSQWWVVGKSSETVRQIIQPMLLGNIGAFGTGMIPADNIDFASIVDAKKADTPVNSFRVRHRNGTYSTVEFKAWEQGRQAFEGTARSIFMDEEPPADVYGECLLRTATGGNILLCTFTPLKGVSEVVMSFLDDGDIESTGKTGEGKYVIRAGWDDIKHLDTNMKRILLESIPPFQREARSKGIPQLGAGAIYPVSEESFVVEPFEIPKHWPRAYGFDVGRNTAAAFIAWDRDSNVLYTYSDYFCIEGLPSTHAQALMARGKWLRGAIDTAARGRSQTDGENLFQMYHELGLNIINADKAVEAGLYEVLELLTQGRLKVFSTCTNLIKEFRGYQRDEKGKIVKKNDHIMDSWRYAIFTRDKILRTEAEYEASQQPLDTNLYDFSESKDSWMYR